ESKAISTVYVQREAIENYSNGKEGYKKNVCAQTKMHSDIINEVWDNIACLIIQAANTAISKKKILNSLANRRKKIGKTTDLAKYSTSLRKIIRNLNKIWKQKITCTEYENINEILKEINVKLNTNLQNIRKKVTIG
ncbi:26306_t:CDS:2, partial [Gigaspora margarita]